MNHDRPRLPSRTPAHRATAETLRLWRLGECTDAAILTRVAAELRALPGPPLATPGNTVSPHETASSATYLPTPSEHPLTAQDNR